MVITRDFEVRRIITWISWEYSRDPGSNPHQRTEHFSPGPCTLIANGEKGEKGANITGSYTQPYIALYCLAKLAEGPTFGVLTGIDSQHVTQIPSIVIF